MSVCFKTSQEQKDYIWSRIHKYYPEFKTGGHYFRLYLNKYINSNSIVLDAGCGAGGILTEFKSIPKLLIGVDTNQESLSKNTTVSKKIHASLEAIPLASNSVDIVTSEFVLEHLQNPESVFKEIFRILKPDGIFIFMTPNVFNPIMLLSKILPQTFHKLLKSKLLKKIEAHPTYYQANSYNKLIQLGLVSNFKDCNISRAGNPEYLGFCKPLVPISIFIEKLFSIKSFNFLQMYLIGCFKK